MDIDSNIVKLGQVLRQRRIELGLSVRDLNKASGVSLGGIVGLESAEYRKPNAEKLRDLAEALNLNTRDLFDLAGYTPDDDLPTIAGLLNVQYRSLPDNAVADIDRYVNRTLRKHGIDPNQQTDKGGKEIATKQ